MQLIAFRWAHQQKEANPISETIFWLLANADLFSFIPGERCLKFLYRDKVDPDKIILPVVMEPEFMVGALDSGSSGSGFVPWPGTLHSVLYSHSASHHPGV